MRVFSQAESLTHFRSKLRFAKLRPVGGKLKSGNIIFDCSQLACGVNIMLYHATMKNVRIEAGKVVTLK